MRSRGGTQTFMRDLAQGLNALGHSVMAFTSDQTQRERLLENDIIPVTTDIQNLPSKPDIIHGQHHLEMMTALTALPGVPAIYHFHGATWKDCIVKHPRVYHYLTMSRTAKERMLVESNIPGADITVLLNPVNVVKFHTVRTLPARPVRALFYNSRHQEDSEVVTVIREAAKLCAIELDLIGFHFGKTAIKPEKLLPEYDIVFASGLSAIEAAACGCAVIVLGRTSCGEMVLPENYERIRQVNFSIASNSPPPSVEAVANELRKYSAQSCAEVTARLRREADLSITTTELVALYERVISQHRQTPVNMIAESLATSNYLRKIVPLIKMTDQMLDRNWASETRATTFDELSMRLELLKADIKKTSQQHLHD